MKKALKALTTLGTAVLAVIGGICVYRKFFAKDQELDEMFDEEDVSADTEEEVKAFDDDSEIFEDEDAPAEATTAAEDAENDKAVEEPAEETAPADPVEKEADPE